MKMMRWIAWIVGAWLLACPALLSAAATCPPGYTQVQSGVAATCTWPFFGVPTTSQGVSASGFVVVNGELLCHYNCTAGYGSLRTSDSCQQGVLYVDNAVCPFTNESTYQISGPPMTPADPNLGQSNQVLCSTYLQNNLRTLAEGECTTMAPKPLTVTTSGVCCVAPSGPTRP